MNLEKKLDEIIKRLNEIEEKISNIDTKIDAVSERLNLLEIKFENRSKEVDTFLQGGPTSALLWATFQNYSSLRASAG